MLGGKMIMKEWKFWKERNKGEDQNSRIKQLNSFKES